MPFDRPYTSFYWSATANISSILYRFWIIWRWIILLPWNLGSRSLKAIQTGTIRKLGCGFLFAFHSNYGSILHHFRDKARYWSKIVIFIIPPLHSSPPLGGFPSEYCHPAWYGTVRLPGSNKILRICSAVSTEYRPVTTCDRRTDRHLATA